MIERTLGSKIRQMSGKFPIVAVTGTRQCGKSTLLKNMFPDYRYVSLEDPDIREFADIDPRGFLQEYRSHVIVDEAQHVPSLFSYLQTAVDSSDTMGQYILSGSHNFLLMEKISQSLAGRCAVLKLAPLSLHEMSKADILPDSVWKMMLTGGYPAIYDRNIDPEDYFPSYVSTYIERDVRSVKNITDSGAFTRFVRLCAARSGQVLVMSDLARDAGISVPTAGSWLSILEGSYLIFKLYPYYKNYSKRLIKSPKIYFSDTGLLCYMLGIETEEQLMKSDFKGNIFETMIVSECRKEALFNGRDPAEYYWMDSAHNEIDLLTENRGELNAYEIKLSETMKKDFFKNLRKFGALAGLSNDRLNCVYRGATRQTAYGNFINYMDCFR